MKQRLLVKVVSYHSKKCISNLFRLSRRLAARHSIVLLQMKAPSITLTFVQAQTKSVCWQLLWYWKVLSKQQKNMKIRRQKYLKLYGELSDYWCTQREILIVEGFAMYFRYLTVHYEVRSYNQVFLNLFFFLENIKVWVSTAMNTRDTFSPPNYSRIGLKHIQSPWAFWQQVPPQRRDGIRNTIV